MQIKQLGSGDVGMVDLVQLVGTDQRFALKSLEKREMLERNKVSPHPHPTHPRALNPPPPAPPPTYPPNSSQSTSLHPTVTAAAHVHMHTGVHTRALHHRPATRSPCAGGPRAH